MQMSNNDIVQAIQAPAFWKFVTENALAAPASLRLKYHGRDGIDFSLAITQIECRRKFAGKLRETLLQFDKFLFPGELAGEQSTSDVLASFHAEIVRRLADINNDNMHIVDMTAGLGIDAMHLARCGYIVQAVDCQNNLCEALQWNATGLGLSTLSVVHGDSVELLQAGILTGDIAFIDPARRSSDGGRVYAISDCQPDVSALLPALGKAFRYVVVKLSPMLDLSQTARDLGKYVTDMYVIGTKTECKEVVAVLDMKCIEEFYEPKIHAVTLYDGKADELEFTRSAEKFAPMPSFGLPAVGDIVYEPWPAIMKAAPFNTLARQYNHIAKVAPNTHVFYAPHPLTEFPGEARTVEAVIPYMSKHIKRLRSSYPQIDVAARNFGMSASALQKKLAVKPGGKCRLLAVRDADDKPYMLVLS